MLRTIFDDDGRPMLFINWNTDMGDGVGVVERRGVYAADVIDAASLSPI